MATAYHNLSEYDFNSVPNAEAMKFGIVVSGNIEIPFGYDDAEFHVFSVWYRVEIVFG